MKTYLDRTLQSFTSLQMPQLAPHSASYAQNGKGSTLLYVQSNKVCLMRVQVLFTRLKPPHKQREQVRQ